MDDEERREREEELEERRQELEERRQEQERKREQARQIEEQAKREFYALQERDKREWISKTGRYKGKGERTGEMAWDADTYNQIRARIENEVETKERLEQDALERLEQWSISLKRKERANLFFWLKTVVFALIALIALMFLLWMYNSMKERNADPNAARSEQQMKRDPENEKGRLERLRRKARAVSGS